MKMETLENMHLEDCAARLVEKAVAAGAEEVEIFLHVEDLERLHWVPYHGIGHRSGLEGNMVVQMNVTGQRVNFTSQSLNFSSIEKQMVGKIQQLAREPQERAGKIPWSSAPEPDLKTVTETEPVNFLEISEVMRGLQERFDSSAFHLHRWECISGRVWTALVRSDGQRMSHMKSKHGLDLLLEGSHGFLVEGEFSPRGDALRWDALTERVGQLLEWPREETLLEPGRIRLSMPPGIGADIARKYGILFSGPRLSGTPELARLIGKRLARPHVTLIDDARLPGGWETRSFDEEGTPSQSTILIDRGIMKKFLHSLGTANQWGVASTGNGVRSRNHSGSVNPSNIYFLPGETDQAQWRRQTEQGVEIVHAVHPPQFTSQSGMIQLIADGWLIRQGRRERQLSSVTVALHPFRFLRKISSFGKDLTFCFHAKGAGSPSIYFDEAEVLEGQIVI